MEKKKQNICWGFALMGAIVFNALNFITKGVVPGGLLGSALGVIVFGGITWIVFYLKDKK